MHAKFAVSTLATGIVKWFDPAKGFGFITSDSHGEDFFVDARDRGHEWRALMKGTRVEFSISMETIQPGRCRRAVAVREA